MAADLSTSVNPSNLLAAIDMGTNSFKMLVVRAEPNGKFLTMDRLKEPVVLGRGMHDHSTTPPTITIQAQHRAISAIRKFQHFLHAHQVHHAKFVATSAVREANNKSEFLSLLEKETSCKVEILSGEEEARLIYFGVLQFLPVYEKIVLTVDIGGGSTEFVIGRHGEVLLAVSLKLGHVSLTEGFVKKGDIANMRKYIRKEVCESGLVEKVRNIGFEYAVGSSGTIRAIEKAVFSGYAEDLMSNVVSCGEFRRKWRFSREELNHVVEKLCDSNRVGEEDLRRKDFFKRRSEFILAGAILLSEIFEVLGIEEIDVSEYALGEGVIAESLAQCSGNYDVNANARWRSIIKLATKFNSDKRMKSSMRCAGIAREFFAGLIKHGEFASPLNEFVPALDAKDLEYVEAACLLHNVGLYIGKKGYHKQSYHIIKNGDYLQGYTAEEVELIALLAKHHRKKFPKSDHSSLQVLPDVISFALQQCLCMTFQRLETSNHQEGFKLVFKKLEEEIYLSGHLQPTVEDIETELKLELDYFQQVYNKKLSIVISSST